MTLHEYLSGTSGSQTLWIVGPFYNERSHYSEPVVFVDRGVFFRKHQEGVSVGDGDSAGQKLQHQLESTKDLSDLAFVLENIPDHFERLILLGFLGARRDHELMNLAEAHRCLKRSSRSRTVLFDQSVQALSKGKWSLQIQGTFSIFAFEPVELFLLGDCRFPLQPPSQLRALSSHGLSNQGFGTVKIETSGPLFLFLNPESEKSEFC
ncbi:MAG: hypothetical protein ACK5Y2_08410 [Bdellovibrionales bacterium]